MRATRRFRSKGPCGKRWIVGVAGGDDVYRCCELFATGCTRNAQHSSPSACPGAAGDPALLPGGAARLGRGQGHASCRRRAGQFLPDRGGLQPGSRRRPTYLQPAPPGARLELRLHAGMAGRQPDAPVLLHAALPVAAERHRRRRRLPQLPLPGADGDGGAAGLRAARQSDSAVGRPRQGDWQRVPTAPSSTCRSARLSPIV